MTVTPIPEAPIPEASLPGSLKTPPRAVGYAFLGVQTVVSIFTFVHRSAPAVLVDAIRADTGMTDVQFAALQGAAFAGPYVLATLVSGLTSDRVNRRNVLVFGVFCWSLGSAVFALASGLPAMVAGRALVGMGEGVLGPAGVSLLCDFVSAKHRGRAFAVFYFGATLGSALAFTIGGALLDAARGGGFAGLPGLGALAPWRQVVLLLTGAGVVLGPTLMAFPEPPRRSTAPAHGVREGLGALWSRRRPVALIYLVGAGVAFADFAFTGWIVALATRGSGGLSVSAAGAALGGASVVAGLAGAWLGGVAADRARARGGPARTAALLALCAAGLFAGSLPLLASSATVALVAYGVWQVVANVAYVACGVTLQDLATDHSRALAASLATFVSIGLGLGFGPSAVALLHGGAFTGPHGLSLSLLAVLAAAAVATGATALLLNAELRRRPVHA